MKTYIWEYVGGITTSWHNGGGLLIITDGDPQEEWKEYRLNTIAHGESWEDNESLVKELPDPDFSYECSSEFKRIVLFPDSGCC